MTSEANFLVSEGDINLTASRRMWHERHIDEATAALLREDETYFLHQSLSTPCLNVLESCDGIYVRDKMGRTYMDFHGNNVHQVGFANPDVIAAVKEQLELLPFSTRRYTNEPAIAFARKLTQLAPEPLNKVLFAPGAAAAMGMALKLARLATGKFKTVSMWDAFHGASLDAISIGGEAVFRKGLGPLLPGAEHAIPYNGYRCFFGDCGVDCAMHCVKHIEYILAQEAGDVGAVVVETIRNTDVQIPPQSYYRALRDMCDRYGALLILDETAIALGRTGTMFAFEHYGIVPDIVVLGKGLGGGVYPMAAVLAKEQLDIAQSTAIGHFTHEKSPLGAAAGLAAIEYIERRGLLRHTVDTGSHMHKRLLQLKAGHPLIGDVRAIGLLAAVELVKDRTTKEKATEEAERVMYRCLELGLNFKVSQGNVLSLSPALIIERGQIDAAVAILDRALRDVAAE